jgi:hypothetical protein
MNTMLEILNKNTLIEGVKVVSEKVFVYDPLGTKGYKALKKFQPIEIIEGLETFIYTNKYSDADYSAVEIVEGVTGAYLYHSPVGVDTLEEARNKCIKEVTKRLTSLQEKGILAKVFSQIASHFGISPRYEGMVEASISIPTELKIGDKLRKVNLRGGVGIYEGEITGISGNEFYKSYKFTVGDGFSTYFDLSRMDKSTKGYYEPEFIEIISEEVKTENIGISIEIENDLKECLTLVTDTLVAAEDEIEDKITVVEVEETKEIVNTSVSNVSQRQFDKWLSDAKDSALKNSSKEIPAEAKETDELLKANGFMLSYNDRLDNKRIHMVYFKPLESVKKIYRVSIDNLVTDKTIETKFQLRLIAPYFKHDELKAMGNVSELEEILKSMNIEITQAITETNVDQKVESNVEEVIDNVYTLEEVIKGKINLKETPVKIEDLTILSDEEYANKRNGIWDWWHNQEGKARRMETPDYSYSKYLNPINEILHIESRRRDVVYASSLTDDEIKYFATKWLNSERIQEIIDKEGKQELLQTLKDRNNSGGSLSGAYRFGIGFVNCYLKDIEIQVYGSVEDGKKRNIKMTYSEVADLLIKHFKVEIQKEAIESLVEAKPIEEVSVKVEAEVKPVVVEEEQLTLFTVTNEDIERLQKSVKTKKKNKALIEGQVSLFAM